MKPITYQYIFDNPNYLKQLKGNSIISINCDYCDNSKNITKRKIQKKIYKKQENFYCNTKCSTLHKRSRIIKHCAQCDKEVTRTPSELEKVNNVFCSKSCAGKYNGHKYPKRILKNKCATCGTLCRSHRKYCSNECNTSIHKSKNWDNITFAELKNNSKAYSNSIRSLSRKIYKKSNKPKYCIICKYKTHYDVCHIKPIHTFSDDTLISVINDLNNLVALCKNHHWELDNNYLKL